MVPCDGKRRRRCPRCWRRGSLERPPWRISKGLELQDVDIAVQKEHNLALGRNSETLAVDSRQVRVYPGKQPPAVRINNNMNSKQFSKNNKPRTTSFEDLTGEGALSVDENFALELRVPISSPVEHEPFVTIEYDDCDNQQDPLAFDYSTESATPNHGNNCYGNVTIYDPFSNYRKDAGLSTDDSALKRKRANQFSEIEPIKAKNKKLYEIAVGRVACQTVGTQTEHVKIVNQDTVRDSAQRRLEDHEVIYVQDDEVVDVQDDADILSELAQQVQQKTMERIRAARELRQKRVAENALAKQLVREILKPDSQQDQYSSSIDLTPKQRRDAANAESAMARQLILQMTRGYSLEKIIQELKSTASSSNSPQPTDSTSRETRTNSCGQPGANEETQGPQWIPAASVHGEQIQQNFQHLMSEGYSPQIVGDVASTAPSSNLQPANSANRENRAYSSVAEEVTQRPQRMEEGEGWMRTCDSWAPSVPAKRIQRKSSTSPSAVSTLQPLPSYAQAFTWRAGQGRANTRGSIVEEPFHRAHMFSMPEQRCSRHGQGSHQRIPLSNTYHPPYQPPYLLPTSSLLSRVHPSHLLPPSSLVVDEIDDVIEG